MWRKWKAEHPESAKPAPKAPTQPVKAEKTVSYTHLLGMKQCKANPWEEFNQSFKKGDKVKGQVKSITDFGVFIGLPGGIDGLVHLSDLSWNCLLYTSALHGPCRRSTDQTHANQGQTHC